MGQAPALLYESKSILRTPHKYPYVYKELGKDFDREQNPENFPCKNPPQIVVNKEKIGGYEAPLSYIENTGYNGTGLRRTHDY